MDTLYFYATDPADGPGVYAFDGTTTTRLADTLSRFVTEWAVLGEAFFFTVIPPGGEGAADLYVSDGTAAGTGSFLGTGSGSFAFERQDPVVSGGTLYFEAFEGGRDIGLFASDGTAAGTTRLTDLGSGGQTAAFAGGLLYNTGPNLLAISTYFTDGTGPGTALTAGVFLDLDFGRTAEAGGRLFAPGRDQSGGLGAVVIEPWITDATPAGTREIADLAPDGASRPADPVAVGGRVFFTANDGTAGPELWVSDGTAAGTRLVADINPGSGGLDVGATPVAALGGRLLFVGDDGDAGRELWISDGTAEDTRLLADIAPGSAGSDPFDGPDDEGIVNHAALGDAILFAADDGASGRELWITDGTAEGTRLLADIAPGSGGSDPGNFVAFGDRVAFVADDGARGAEIWVTDGTAAGTVLLADVVPGAASSEPLLATAVSPNIAPADLALSADRVTESSPPGTPVGTLSATDANGDPLAFRLTDDAGGRFAIADGTGLVVAGALDFETAESHRITVEVDDGRGGTRSESFTVAVIDAAEGPDNVNGTLGDDSFADEPGGQAYDGFAGRDSVAYALPRDAVAEAVGGDGTVTVTRLASGTVDSLTDIERVVLGDGVYVYDLPGEDVPFVYRLYSAAFARTPDEGGLRFWNALRNDGLTNREAAAAFVASAEFAEKFGEDPTDGEFIAALYQNVLLREPDEAGEAFWLEAFSSGEQDRESMLFAFSNSRENVERNADNYDDGVWVV